MSVSSVHSKSLTWNKLAAKSDFLICNFTDYKLQLVAIVQRREINRGLQWQPMYLSLLKFTVLQKGFELQITHIGQNLSLH